MAGGVVIAFIQKICAIIVTPDLRRRQIAHIGDRGECELAITLTVPNKGFIILIGSIDRSVAAKKTEQPAVSRRSHIEQGSGVRRGLRASVFGIRDCGCRRAGEVAHIIFACCERIARGGKGLCIKGVELPLRRDVTKAPQLLPRVAAAGVVFIRLPLFGDREVSAAIKVQLDFRPDSAAAGVDQRAHRGPSQPRVRNDRDGDGVFGDAAIIIGANPDLAVPRRNAGDGALVVVHRGDVFIVGSPLHFTVVQLVVGHQPGGFVLAVVIGFRLGQILAVPHRQGDGALILHIEIHALVINATPLMLIERGEHRAVSRGQIEVAARIGRIDQVKKPRVLPGSQVRGVRDRHQQVPAGIVIQQGSALDHLGSGD